MSSIILDVDGSDDDLDVFSASSSTENGSLASLFSAAGPSSKPQARKKISSKDDSQPKNSRVYLVNIFSLVNQQQYRPVGKGGLTLLAGKTVVIYKSKRQGPLAAVSIDPKLQQLSPQVFKSIVLANCRQAFGV